METAKILIVEDESVVALDIEDALTTFGYQVLGTEAWGEKALERAKSLIPDIILMDIRLKGDTDGIKACRQIKATLGLPVIFLTAHADEATLQRAKGVDADGYILKPFEPQELRAVIELALSRATRGTAEAGELRQPWSDEVPVDSDDERYSLLTNTQLFELVPESIRMQIAEQSVMRQLDSGTLLWEEGAPITKSFIVISGKGAFIKTSENGKEMIVELLAPGDVLPVVFALNLVPTAQKAPFQARLQSPGHILEIPLSALRTAATVNQQLAQFSLGILLQRLNAAYERTRSLAHDPVENRICVTLKALAPQFAKACRGTAYSIYITRQELADLTGTTTETAIRTTKNLERSGALDLTRPGIIRVLDDKLLPF